MHPVSHRPGWTLLVASVAAFMTSLDTMVVTTALPTMRSHLGGSVGQLEWTMNAYYLAFACLLITAAALGDRLGRRRVLFIGLVVFGLSSAGAAAAPGLGSLIAARAVQGGAAAAVMPLTLTVISEAYPPETRGKAIGIWGALLGAGGVLGPLAGGGLVELVGWRGIFWVNVPIALVVAIVGRLVITETYGPRHPLDVRGLVLASAGCLGLAWGLVRSADMGWDDASVWGPLAVGAALVVAFVVAEHSSPFPMMPTRLFRSRSFSAANGVSICIYASLSGSVYLMSQFFQIAQHASPIVAALRFAPWPAPALLVAPLVGSYATKVGNRPFLVVGMALHAIGMTWFVLVVHASTPYLALWPARTVGDRNRLRLPNGVGGGRLGRAARAHGRRRRCERQHPGAWRRPGRRAGRDRLRTQRWLRQYVHVHRRLHRSHVGMCCAFRPRNHRSAPGRATQDGCDSHCRRQG
jgi:EmrB/QacA subfamily drug resistance transporter